MDKNRIPVEKFDRVLEQPFLTEEGFVNPACMNELEAAINNIPPAYERLKNEPEWSEKRWTLKKHITSAFAKWVIRQSKYSFPKDLDIVIKYLDACLSKSIQWDKFGFAQLSLCDVNKLLFDILFDMEQIEDWNTPRKDWRDSEFDCFNEAEEADPDYGFIDIYALFKNVCLDIRDERRTNDKFDKEFEKEWKEEHGTDDTA